MSNQHRIIITGSSGFVGHWLLKALHEKNDDKKIKIVTLGRNENCDYNVDIVDRSSLDHIIQTVQPTAIIHLAAIAAPMFAHENKSLTWSVNLQGTLNIADSVLSNKPDCRMIFSGSSEAYGRSFAKTKGHSITEDAALEPMSTYGATKAAADIALSQMYYDGLRSVRFRPFNHTGPGQSDAYVTSAFALQIANIMQGKSAAEIKVGNLQACRDFLDVRDVVQAYKQAALDLDKNIDGMVFNLSSGLARPIQSILDILIEKSGLEIKVLQDPDRMRPVGIETAYGNAEAAYKHLGWKPIIPFLETITDVLDDWQHRLTKIEN